MSTYSLHDWVQIIRVKYIQKVNLCQTDLTGKK